MKVIVTGGGTGGHITPALAVAYELKQLRPDAHITYIGQTGDSLSDVPEQDKHIDQVLSVRAGKFRRYHGEGLKQLFDVVTLYKNLRDAIWVLVGLWQSFWLLGKLRPEVIFTRGSYVSVPVCLAAALRGIPYITHDSDAIPSLANRLIARWAKVHAVALPKEIYTTYPPGKTVTVGVPISHTFTKVSAGEAKAWREQLSLDKADKILFVTGGGNGADRLNKAVMSCVPELLERYDGLMVVHVTGRSLEADVRQRYKQLLPPDDQERVVIKGFVTNLYQYSGVADVVVTRAGGSSTAEFAAQAKACVVVPNPQLTGGHQLKNAKVLADRKAIKLVSEEKLREDPRALMPALTELFDHPDKAKALGEKLAELAQPNAAHLLAVVLLEVVEGKVADAVT
jgi:UDP-N-acetylglucosamine--N-acetylmuramyl-(pentapeptide) pyrophosphoryl-undecaprenol N-acetylglucosamine transferase